MFKAFKNRRPWVAVLISLFIGPWLGMLFLNRGRWALVYLFALALLIISMVGILPGSFLHGGSAKSPLNGANAVLAVGGAIHAYFVARRWDREQRLAWYSGRWHLIAGIPLSLMAALLGVRAFLYQPFNIPSASMFPSVWLGDGMLVSKSEYRFSDPDRGDVVVFWDGRYRVNFVKRVVGIPGDRVQMVGGQLVLNGEKVPMHRIANFTGSCDTGHGCSVPQYEETFPNGRKVRVLDALPHGPLDDTDAFVVPTGCYFVLGDNLDNSDDSRSDIGFVSRGAIIGRAAFKYINYGHWTWQRIT